jgi:hypothetical protein
MVNIPNPQMQICLHMKIGQVLMQEVLALVIPLQNPNDDTDLLCQPSIESPTTVSTVLQKHRVVYTSVNQA